MTKVKKVEEVVPEEVKEEVLPPEETLEEERERLRARLKVVDAGIAAKPITVAVAVVHFATPQTLSPDAVALAKARLAKVLLRADIVASEIEFRGDIKGKGIVRPQGTHEQPNPGINRKAEFWAFLPDGKPLDEVDGVRVPCQIDTWKKAARPDKPGGKDTGINPFFVHLLPKLWLVYKPEGKKEKAVVKPRLKSGDVGLPGEPPAQVKAFVKAKEG